MNYFYRVLSSQEEKRYFNTLHHLYVNVLSSSSINKPYKKQDINIGTFDQNGNLESIFQLNKCCTINNYSYDLDGILIKYSRYQELYKNSYYMSKGNWRLFSQYLQISRKEQSKRIFEHFSKYLLESEIIFTIYYQCGIYTHIIYNKHQTVGYLK